MQTLEAVLQSRIIANIQNYPKDLKELVDEGFIGEKGLKDGRGNNYNYEALNDNKEYRLSSNGKDGIQGTGDDIPSKMGK